MSRKLQGCVVPNAHPSRVETQDKPEAIHWTTLFLLSASSAKTLQYGTYTNKLKNFAKKENKLPVLVIKKKGKHGELFIVNDRYLKAFIENWEANNEESKSNNQNQ